jgi:CDP-glycerol glycerophosphotransferase (TagB/SpsB family)
MRKIMAHIAFGLFRWVAERFPKSDRLVLFGARRGLWYTDSPSHVFEQIVQNEPRIKGVWMTRDDKVVDHLVSKGLPVCHAASVRAFFLLMRARLAVTSAQLHDVSAVPECVPDSLRIVFLGHGKSVKASSLAKRGDRSPWSRWVFLRAAELTDVAASTSPFISGLAAKSNALPAERFVVTGYPDNDLLVHPPAPLKARWNEYIQGVSPRAVVLYAPTWRKGQEVRFFPFKDFDKHQLRSFLEKNMILMLLRPHERDLLEHDELRGFLRSLDDETEWIRVCDQSAFGNVNHVLPFVDILISDYSSIYNDFLLLDRPMVFVPYDLDEFARTQGFMYDYLENLPGPAVYTRQEFFKALEEAVDDRDSYQAQRHRQRQMIHTQTDGRATQRIIEILLDRLGPASRDDAAENGHP